MSDKKYKVNPLTGELQEYIFEYNGILALRNFQTKLDGERLILHHADDVNFSLLETLVSEVEINGVVYDNPTAAQEALTRLTFNQNRPTILPQEERALITNALQRGDYIGTARDLFNLINGKVDKVPGKKLTTEDFTTELRKKLEGLQQVDISLLLPRGNFTGTAQDLKDLIDNLTRILQSPDTELDELQEIVAYIKQNKHILSTLGISNIAGLEDALANKADKDHNHDEVYAPKKHTHPEYSHRTHQHHWDDFLGKPNNLATTQNIEDAINNIQIGGRNYLLNSKPRISQTFSEYGVIKEYDLSQNLEAGETYILKLKNYKTEPRFFLWNSGWEDSQEIYKEIPFIASKAFKKIIAHTKQAPYECDFEMLKLERGNKPTDWTPAPEDFLPKNVSIEENWTATKEWADSTIFTQGSCNVELNQLPHLASISFRRTFVGEAVTFTCAGKQIIYTGDTSFNGGDGSTAVVSIWNNKCYIDIRNI